MFHPRLPVREGLPSVLEVSGDRVVSRLISGIAFYFLDAKAKIDTENDSFRHRVLVEERKQEKASTTK